MRIRTEQTIVYEQPLNELVRVCLRLEQLFLDLGYFQNVCDKALHRAGIAALVDTINVLDRPDLKTKLNQELNRYLHYLSRLQETPSVNNHKLSNLIAEIEASLSFLHIVHGKLAQSLRENEFLQNIRQHLLSPGGGCSFDTPNYHYWLSLPDKTRTDMFNEWRKELRPLEKTISLILGLTRENSRQETVFAEQGFYQATLDPQKPCHLIRVRVPVEQGLYPEISAGRHRLYIRFYEPRFSERSRQNNSSFSFVLEQCYF